MTKLPDACEAGDGRSSLRHSEGAAPVHTLEVAQIYEAIRHHHRRMEALLNQLEALAQPKRDRPRAIRRLAR